MKYFVVVIMVIFVTSESYSQPEAADIHHVSVEKFKAAIDSLQDEVIVDLRTPEELKEGKIPGALVIDFFGPAFDPAIAALDRDKVYLLYCAAGGRSSETADIMRELGFKTIYNLEGGFRDWVKKKMPVENGGK